MHAHPQANVSVCLCLRVWVLMGTGFKPVCVCATSDSALPSWHFLQGSHICPSILSGLATGNRGLTSATPQEVCEQMFSGRDKGLSPLLEEGGCLLVLAGLV